MMPRLINTTLFLQAKFISWLWSRQGFGITTFQLSYTVKPSYVITHATNLHNPWLLGLNTCKFLLALQK